MSSNPFAVPRADPEVKPEHKLNKWDVMATWYQGSGDQSRAIRNLKTFVDDNRLPYRRKNGVAKYMAIFQYTGPETDTEPPALQHIRKFLMERGFVRANLPNADVFEYHRPGNPTS
ncbi:potassium transporter-like protein [Metarhizium robertsii]|uniref:Ankyrin repeat-containing domain protein n=2 Tax=Metarhizium robertsii TaxID=568076 RepID=A0A0B2XDA7_METRA|nr:Ankyrin repeat-containing domain protein [Metarhizium robertsii ARSEF 23]EXU99370.1 potassium transporter-like protein [Metarhizium robertsii]KHO10700.1 Ankyrin repeat-containing domain protein [Metarhizium robertsii ARSEF 23]